MVESAFSVEAMARGYHIYRDIWTAVVNEELRCFACSSCVNFVYLPLFADCFDAVAVAASYVIGGQFLRQWSAGIGKRVQRFSPILVKVILLLPLLRSINQSAAP